MAPKRILILTADAGFGHRSAANAIAEALEQLYGDRCEYSIFNPLMDRRVPFFLRDSQSDYDKLVRRMPELYRFGFDASDATVPAAITEQALVVMMYEVMHDLITSFRPDVIISTYPLYLAPLSAVMTIRRLSIPVLVAVTDLATVHRLWFNNNVDLCLAPTDLVRDLAINYGLLPQQVQVTGIPVSPKIAQEQRSPAEIRDELGWEQGLVTALAVGSRRVDRLLDTLNILNHYGVPLQLVVVAGKDEALYRELQEMEWHVPVRLYEYVSNMPVMMKAADVLVSKAGGLIVTEALACGLPLLLIDAIPGQETGNADYVVQNGAGDLARTYMEVLEMFAHLMMNNGRLLRERAENARQLGRPDAAYQAAAAVWKAAQLTSPHLPPATGRLRLIDLLTRNEVHWDDEPGSNRAD